MDSKYGSNNKYVQKLSKMPQLKHMSNEKKCFQQLVPYHLHPFKMTSCYNASDLISFFTKYKKDMLYKCGVRSTYSHCQEFYVITYDTSKNECSSYRRKPCKLYYKNEN